MSHSEVAQLRESIANEYVAAQLGLSGLASGVSRHEVITAKMERIQQYHEQLQSIVGKEAFNIFNETLATLPDKPTRYAIVDVIRRELPKDEETDILIGRLWDMWETHDLLLQQFGAETMEIIINASEPIHEPL